MLSERMLDALNRQVHRELYASHLYLAMSAYFEDETLPGFGKWMRGQSQEERSHALRIFDYVYDRGGHVRLDGFDKPGAAFTSPLNAMEHALAHEQKVTASIHALYELAEKEADYPTRVMLNWFVEEQVEEEKTATEIIDKLRRVGENPAALLMIDKWMGEREG